MSCDHSLAHKTDSVELFNCDVNEKGHRKHRNQFHRVVWTVEPDQTPFRSQETGRRVVWSTDVTWRRY